MRRWCSAKYPIPCHVLCRAPVDHCCSWKASCLPGLALLKPSGVCLASCSTHFQEVCSGWCPFLHPLVPFKPIRVQVKVTSRVWNSLLFNFLPQLWWRSDHLYWSLCFYLFLPCLCSCVFFTWVAVRIHIPKIQLQVIATGLGKEGWLFVDTVQAGMGI